MSFEEQLEEKAREDAPVEEALRDEVQVRIEAELEADRIRKVEAEARLRAEEEARQREWEAKPLPYRLTYTRCTGCHTAESFETRAYSRIGWELIILRMRVLNKARLEPGERGQIAGYLAEAHPASMARAAGEIIIGVILLALPFILGRWVSRFLRRRRKKLSERAS